MGFSLKGIFKSKPGGTFVGNLVRGVVGAAAAGGLPGAGLVASFLPAAPPPVVDLGQQLVAQAAQMPALPPAEIKWVAQDAKSAILAAGGTADQASMVGAAAFSAASLPPVDAKRLLDDAHTQVATGTATGNAFTKEDIKTVLNGLLDGAKAGGADAYLNKTETGKEQKRDAINAAGKDIMPWVSLGLLGLVGIMAVTRR